jgi:hypothetical protein
MKKLLSFPLFALTFGAHAMDGDLSTVSSSAFSGRVRFVYGKWEPGEIVRIIDYNATSSRECCNIQGLVQYFRVLSGKNRCDCAWLYTHGRFKGIVQALYDKDEAALVHNAKEQFAQLRALFKAKNPNLPTDPTIDALEEAALGGASSGTATHITEASAVEALNRVVSSLSIDDVAKLKTS